VHGQGRPILKPLYHQMKLKFTEVEVTVTLQYTLIGLLFVPCSVFYARLKYLLMRNYDLFQWCIMYSGDASRAMPSTFESNKNPIISDFMHGLSLDFYCEIIRKFSKILHLKSIMNMPSIACFESCTRKTWDSSSLFEPSHGDESRRLWRIINLPWKSFLTSDT